MTVEQLADQPTAGLDIAIGGGGEQGFAFGAEEIMDGLMSLLRETTSSSSSCTASATGW